MSLELCSGGARGSYRHRQSGRAPWNYGESLLGHDGEGRGLSGHRTAAARACRVLEVHSLDMAQGMVREDQEVRRMGMARSLEQGAGNCYHRTQS